MRKISLHMLIIFVLTFSFIVPSIPASADEGTDVGSNKSGVETVVTDESPTEEIEEVEEENEVTKPEPVIKNNVVVPSFGNGAGYYETTNETRVYAMKNGTETIIGLLKAGFGFYRIGGDAAKHNIVFSDQSAYVYAADTKPAVASSVRIPVSATTGDRQFTVHKTALVYDNSTGALVPFASLERGSSFPIIGTMGLWYKINVSGTVGFIHSSFTNPNFKAGDTHFDVRNANIPAYDNSTGKLVKTVTLQQGQQYKIHAVAGNWISFNYGAKLLHVFKGDVAPAAGNTIKNATTNVKSAGKLITFKPTPVNDNSSGVLVPFATIDEGKEIDYIAKAGTWYTVNIGGRIGHIHQTAIKLPFKSTDQYVEILFDGAVVMDTTSGALVPVGTIEKGALVKRTGSLGNWHKIQWGTHEFFVHESKTRPPYNVSASMFNAAELKNSDIKMYVPKDTAVLASPQAGTKPFAKLNAKDYLPLVKDERGYWVVTIGGRIGYVSKEDVIVGPVVSKTKYNRTFSETHAIQMKGNPQTDMYRNNPAYVHRNDVEISYSGPRGTVGSAPASVYEKPDSNSHMYGIMPAGTAFDIKATDGDWLIVNFGAWRSAKAGEVVPYLDPSIVKPDSADYYQFLVLSKNAGVKAHDLNTKILAGKGTLAGKGKTFIEASYEHNINEIYLVAHALLETGHGTSELATGKLVSEVKGKPVEPKIVYNMFGIGAYDSCPEQCGSERAYENGWFTPELAIMGGAKFISEMYVNHPTYKQDTLYKMKWNPQTPGVHQYATDIGWARKQVPNIKKLYDLIDHFTLYFDIPEYK